MRLESLSPILIIALGVANGACASMQHDMSAKMEAQQQGANKNAIAIQRDNLKRSYGDMAAKIEMEEAKYQGHIDGLNEGAKADPSLPLIEKQHATLVDKTAEVATQYEAAIAAADSGDSSMDATQAFMRQMTGIQQDQAQLLTAYGRLYSEVMQLRSRH